MANDIPMLPQGAQLLSAPKGATPALPPGATLMIDEKQINRRQGAPFKVRAAVSAASNPQDRLATLRQFYPDAQPYDGNFIFTDPTTGQITLFDEDEGWFSGVTAGDLADVGKDAAEVVGGTAGAIFGTGAGPVGTVAGGAGGAVAGRNAYELAVKGMIPEVQDTRGVGQILMDNAGTAAAGATGEMGGMLLNRGIQKGAAKLAGVTPEHQAAMDFASKMGMQPTLGTATGNTTVQAVEQNLIPKMSASGGGVVRNANEAYMEGLDDAAGQVIVDATGTAANKEAAGQAIQSGLKQSVDDFNARRTSLEDALTQVIGRDTRVDASELFSLRDRLVAEKARFPGRANQIDPAIKEIDALMEEAAQVPMAGGGISYGTLRNSRTAIGDKKGRRDASGYAPGSSRYVDDVYGTINTLLSKQAAETGDDAVRLQTELDDLIKANRQEVMPDGTKNPTSIKERTKLIEAKDPLATYRLATSGAKESGAVLSAIRQNMPADEWNTFVSAFSSNLGRDTAGNFSPAKFLKDWDGMIESTKVALYSGELNGLRKNLDQIASVSRPFLETSKEINRSQTGRGIILTSMLGGGGVAGAITGDLSNALYGAAAAAVSELGGYGMAKLMTSQKFTKWLLDSSSSLAASPKSLPRVLSRLYAIGEAEPEIQSLIDVYGRQFEGINP